jgi:hypothetical protein
MTGTSPVLPRQMRTAACATRSSVPFSCACVKEQRYAGEGQEQLHREAADDVVQAHAAQIHADDPRQREAEHADVELTETAHDHRNRQRGERQPGETHRAPSINRASSTAGWTAVSPVKSAI